jgi:hypothetical protein
MFIYDSYLKIRGTADSQRTVYVRCALNSEQCQRSSSVNNFESLSIQIQVSMCQVGSNCSYLKDCSASSSGLSSLRIGTILVLLGPKCEGTAFL